jgi:hypothetical protein
MMMNKYMALKDIYKKVEEDKSNSPKGKMEVSMEWDDFCEEHFCLIRTLREGSREELLAEAEKQEEELEEKCKEMGVDYDQLEEEYED